MPLIQEQDGTFSLSGLEIFRVGNYGDKGEYSEDDLKQIAESYSAETHEAPVTVDHEPMGEAKGWVTRVYAEGNKLFADLAKIPSEFAAKLKDGRWKKRSVEIYKNFQDSGKRYLKAVSFLGAAAPHVKGMSDPVFQDGDGRECVMFVSDVDADIIEHSADVVTKADVKTLIDEAFSEFKQGGASVPEKETKGNEPESKEQVETFTADDVQRMIDERLSAEREARKAAEAKFHASAEEVAKMRAEKATEKFGDLFAAAEGEGKVENATRPAAEALFSYLFSNDGEVTFKDNAGAEKKLNASALFSSFISDLPKREARVAGDGREATKESVTITANYNRDDDAEYSAFADAVSARANAIHTERANSGNPISWVEATSLAETELKAKGGK